MRPSMARASSADPKFVVAPPGDRWWGAKAPDKCGGKRARVVLATGLKATVNIWWAHFRPVHPKVVQCRTGEPRMAKNKAGKTCGAPAQASGPHRMVSI